MKKSLLKIAALGGLLTPLFALGQAGGTAVEQTVSRARDLVRTVIPAFMGIAVIVFLWGIVRFMTAAGDDEKRKSAIHLITYGIIGMFVMVAIWGIIAVAGQFLGITPSTGAPGFNVPQTNVPAFQ